MPCELFWKWCCFTFPSKVFRAPFIEAKDLFLHEVPFLLMFSIDAHLGFCQGGGGESLPVTYQNYWCMLIMIFSVRQMQKLIVGNCELEYFNLLWINLICRISAGFSAILLTSMSSLLHCWVCWRQQLKLQMKANSQQLGNALKKWQRYEVLMTEK